MKIATFNVNSVRIRLPTLLRWLQETQPDVVLLQEIKCVDADFPTAALAAAGYVAVTHGQKSYNGVAILSRTPVTDVRRGLPGDPTDAQARYLEGTIAGIRVASIYLPNGNPVDSEKYPYKLRWIQRLQAHVVETLLPAEIPFVLGGDYNVIPDDRDVHDPDAWRGDALFRTETRAAFRALAYTGLTDAWRGCHPNDTGIYSYWDYTGGRWARNEGLRIDHFLLCPRAADRLRACWIENKPRGWDRPSDHAPVLCQLRDQPPIPAVSVGSA